MQAPGATKPFAIAANVLTKFAGVTAARERNQHPQFGLAQLFDTTHRMPLTRDKSTTNTPLSLINSSPADTPCASVRWLILFPSISIR